MIAKIKTNFWGKLELELEQPTLKQILFELSKRIKFAILNPATDELQGDFKIYLNGIEYENLTDGININTELKEEDEVEVTMVILAGG
jgi:hypothetical protein